MDLALKLNVLAVFAVFAFVGAVVLGAFWSSGVTTVTNNRRTRKGGGGGGGA